MTRPPKYPFGPRDSKVDTSSKVSSTSDDSVKEHPKNPTASQNVVESGVNGKNSKVGQNELLISKLKQSRAKGMCTILL